MKVSDYEFGDFHDALLEGNKQRNWLVVGLVVSLLLHLALCAYFYRTTFTPASALGPAVPEPPTFKVRNVDLKSLEQLSQDQNNPAAKPEADKTDVQQADEKKSFDQLLQDVHASAALPDDTRDVLPEKPLVEQPNATSVINEIEKSTAQVLSQSPNATREQTLLSDAANSGRPQPAINGTELATSTTIKRPNVFNKLPGDSAGPTRGRAPGFSDIDQLLSQKGPLGSGTKLRMPDDQLFAYDSADLQPGSIEQLQKLGTLIKRNPKATFTVEGYTDSLGSADYNLDLSQRRADSVKRYLVESMGINPDQIQTHGYGAAKFLVSPRASAPPTGTAEEQAEIERQKPNRRVVITVHTNDAPAAEAKPKSSEQKKTDEKPVKHSKPAHGT
jgi:outer membrane protein OmpA-like peptidoglycan-associated protein